MPLWGDKIAHLKSADGKSMQDRLNFFEPWERPAHHEDQLTRALLVVLRYCPIAHQVWLSLVDAAVPSSLDPSPTRLSLHSLPRPKFDTQRAQILRSGHQPKTNEPIKGISVLCSADASNEVRSPVLESDRGMVLDGIITYGDDTVIVLESKLQEGADDSQASNINFHGQPIQFDGLVRKIAWRDILANFIDLVDEKRSLLNSAEREVVNDFLAFVEKNFPQLGPFNTIERCAGEPTRVGRRLHAILSEVLSADEILSGIHTSVKLARLEYENETQLIKLYMWPGDTLDQARSFYARRESIERVLELQSDGWSVSPNFHFGFMASGYCWADTTLPVADYMRYWLKHIGDAGRIERQGWDQYWYGLLDANIVEPDNREDFDRHFTNTARTWATPRPGIKCAFAWRIDAAEHLDANATFTNDVKKRINQVLEALGEDSINPE
jgi:hypothetical protein